MVTDGHRVRIGPTRFDVESIVGVIDCGAVYFVTSDETYREPEALFSASVVATYGSAGVATQRGPDR